MAMSRDAESMAFAVWTRVLLCGCILAPAPALRGDTAAEESIELLVADSDRIVRGRVRAVEHGEDRRLAWEIAVVKVAEVLKGEKCQSVSFIVYRYLRTPRLALAWQENGFELLLFLVTGERYRKNADRLVRKKHPWALRDRRGLHSAIELNGKPGRHIFTFDLVRLRKKDEILKAARVAAAFTGGARHLKTHFIALPLALTPEGFDFHSLGVFFPVDRRLEERAHEWVKSDHYHLRMDGVNALRYFRSDENLAILRDMLSDPIPAPHCRYLRLYRTRGVAYRILKGWGIDVPEPVTRERVRTATAEKDYENDYENGTAGHQ